ncbi:peroxidase family protein [Dictyobacter formicarum]|uniref:Myeloperoxidase n=1 Tax=Dictyobacter formicarum TaxID=2778368 RepID=A0ABQ3VCA7_9CHLR|nr:heme peroxidase family protein [Dictyobacter formicarum]GHO83684.1 myeloperoxidase [Dictyobacter formicarum]
MNMHSCVISPHLKSALSPHAQTVEGSQSKYGRLFADLPPLAVDEALLLKLGRAGSVMDLAARSSGDQESLTDNPRIPAGFTFLGQFIAHDITADRSLLLHHARLKELRNFRQPRLDLECIYGAGPSGDPFLYDLDDSDKFLLGINDAGNPDDVPRNRQGRALVADPRNDVHLFISQLHLALLKFHNRVVDHLRLQGTPAAAVFDEARRLVRWHYQWIIVHEFLPLTVGEDLVEDILEVGPRFFAAAPGEQAYIPVEFADAAYRFGHSQIRSRYLLNSRGASGQVFPDCAGTCPVDHTRALEWSYYFSIPGSLAPQASKRINSWIAHSLMDLPVRVVGETDIPEQKSLAYRDLERGEALDLPSGEAIAGLMHVRPLTPEEVGLRKLGWQGETPLWYYLLKEAEVYHHGEYMGPVGGRIIAEVLLGLLLYDPTSYWHAPKGWIPTFPAALPQQFSMAALLMFAGVA